MLILFPAKPRLGIDDVKFPKYSSLLYSAFEHCPVLHLGIISIFVNSQLLVFFLLRSLIYCNFTLLSGGIFCVTYLYFLFGDD